MIDSNSKQSINSDSPPKKRRITVVQLMLMTTAAVVSYRGIPLMAQEELTMYIYLFIAAILFLIPASLVSAELGTAFAQEGGGVYTWVKEAFNKKVGFVAIFLQWTQNIVWYPITITCGSAAIAYIIDRPDLALNGKFIGTFTILIYWLSTLITFKKSSIVPKISSIGFIYGTLLPLLLLFGIAIYWIIDKNPIEFNHIPANQTLIAQTIDGITSPRLLPHLTNIGNIVFLSTIMLLFSGIEALAVHSTELDKPKTQFPKAIFSAAFLGFIVLACGATGISIILPYEQIQLQSGVIDAFSLFFNHYNLNFLTNIIGVLIVIGCTASVITWITGPSSGLLFTAKDNLLPKFMTVVNENGIQKNILIIQGIAVTLLCSLFFIMDDVSDAFFLLSALNGALYIVMYILMYLAGIRLRVKQPNLPRPFQVPGGKYGMFVFGGVGFISVTLALILCFIPPSELPISSPLFYSLFLIIGTVTFILIPILISNYMEKQQNITLTKN